MRLLWEQNKGLFLLGMFIILLIVGGLALVIYLLFGKKKNAEKDVVTEKKVQKQEKISELRKVAAPDGIDPNPKSY